VSKGRGTKPLSARLGFATWETLASPFGAPAEAKASAGYLAEEPGHEPVP